MASYFVRSCSRVYSRVFSRFSSYPTSVLFSSQSNANISSAFQILGLRNFPDISQAEIKEAYLKQAKKYHPDSVSSKSNTEKFIEIRQAYTVCMHSVRTRLCNVEDTAFENELDELDSELGYKKFHQVQHRQFLTYDGIGTGTISQRQKAYQQRRLDEALENVFQRKYQKAMANPDEKSVSLPDQGSHKRRSRWDLSQRKLTGAIERLAEDLIQEAMARGEFDNVKGKPLDSSQPIAHFVDSTTYRLNKVLITSGFSPEWATIGREISNDVESLKHKIYNKWTSLKCNSMKVSESPQWRESLVEWEEEVARINKKIAKFNLLVPNLMQQKGPCSLQRLISNIIGTI